MKVIVELDALPAGMRFVATVGVFDGMHRGHAQVLHALTRLGAELAATPVVLTFHPHPQVLIAGSAPPLLCDPAERLTLLEAAGIGVTILQRFDEAFRMQSAETFLHRLSVGRDLAGLVMSSESAFGHDRDGTVDTARRIAAHEGWRLREVPTLEVGGARVSSGRIRSLVAEGRLDQARRLLGRRYAVSGRPQPADGTGRGQVVDFEAPVALPREGVYEVRLGPPRAQRTGLLRVHAGHVALRQGAPSERLGAHHSEPLVRIELTRRVARERWMDARTG